MRRPSAAAVVGAILLVAISPVEVVRAAEYTLETVVRYTVEPGQHRIVVAVEAVFANTTPDPPGQFSVFEVVDLAVQVGASEVVATDADGPLNVSVGERDGFTLVSVRPRSPVRYGAETTFALTYLLPDEASARVRVRPSVVIFPAWSFGTSGRVSVELPAGYEVMVDGGPLTAETTGDMVRLESGGVTDPAGWLALVTATRPSSYATVSRNVPLGGEEVELQVRAWSDDPGWGETTLELLAAALPLLEAAAGFAFPGASPLVVTETVPEAGGGFAEPSLVPGASGMVVGFDEPPFTILHQAAHLWFSADRAGERWILEGFASWAAAAVGPQVGVEPPYLAAERAEALAADAFPLVSWGVGDSSPAQDAYAHAASWALVDRIVAAIGEDGVRTVWARISAGVSAYDPIGPELPEPDAGAGAPVDSRRLLDHLEAIGGVDLAPDFAELVLDEASAAELSARATARAAYVELLAAAGDLGAPEPVRAAMSEWRFAPALERIAAAGAWLAERERLLAEIADAGLTAPRRLADRYRTAGGGSDAFAEIEAERDVVQAYLSAAGASAATHSVVEWIGLFGERDAVTLLGDARAAFAEGDLRGAADALDRLRGQAAGAATAGGVRVASAAVVLFALLALGLTISRRRRASDYTARP